MSKHKIIVALDPPYPNNKDGDFSGTIKLVKELGDLVEFYKVGMRLFDNFGSIIRFLLRENKKVFLDFKLFDIPSTIIQTIKSANNINKQFATEESYIKFITLSRTTPRSISSVIESKVCGNIKILYVPSLTSYEEQSSEILSQSEKAFSLGCSGIVCSGDNVKKIREKLSKAIIVVPGIRPAWANIKDDQVKTTTPEQAVEDGANYIVVGRPILTASNRRLAVEKITKEIESL